MAGGRDGKSVGGNPSPSPLPASGERGSLFSIAILPSCHLAIALLSATTACGQVASEFAARGSPLGLEADLQAALVRFLREDPSDPIALETAQVLEDRSVPIRLVPVPEPSIGAVYDQVERAILINLDYIASRYAAGPVGEDNRDLVVEGIRSSWERSPESLRAFVADMAPLLVHELRHALLARRLGPHPSSIEEEMACHAYEALFVRRRLKRDPGYLGFPQYDGLVRQYLREPPARGRPWWRDPFPFSPIQRIAESVEKVNAEFPGRFKLNPLLWLHVRGLAEGFAHYRLVFISTYPQEKFSLETDPKVILAELRGLRQDRAQGPQPPSASGIHAIALKFWGNAERVRSAREAFDGEWPKLEAMIAQENGGD